MATSGNERPHGRRLVLIAATVALACVAASWASDSQREARAWRAPQRWCRAQPNAAWRRVLSTGVLPMSRRVALVPWSLAHDGRSSFASIYKPGGSMGDAWTGHVRSDQQAAADADLPLAVFGDIPDAGPINCA
jgi:hypothetical protein